MAWRRTALLGAVTLLLVVAALWFARGREPQPVAAGSPVLPGLDIAAVESVRIVAGGDRVIATLDRGAHGWTVAERGGYPADRARVNALLDALASLESEEPKTRDPTRHAVLGVEDPHLANAQGLRIEISGRGPRRALVIGRAAADRGVYVRLDGDPQSHLAAPAVEVARDVKLWLDRQLLDVKAARIAAFDVQPASGPPYRIERRSPTDEHFRLATLPRGREPYDPAIADPQAALLESFTVDDVASATAQETAASAGSASPARIRFTTFDGLRIDITGRRDGERAWIEVAAAAADAASPPPAVRAEIERIAARTRGRRFEVSAYRHDLLFKPLDGFLK